MASPLTGQVAVSGTAQALSATPISCTMFRIKAPVTNAKPVFYGAPGVTLTTGDALDPGESVTFEISDQHGVPRQPLKVSDFFVVGTSPDVVSWFAVPA